MKMSALLGAAAVAFFPLPAVAQAAGLESSVLNDIVEMFRSQAGQWEGVLKQLAIGLFAALVAIELTWVFGKAAMKKMDVGDVLELIVMQMITIGFFFWLLLNSASFVLAIIDSFGEAANQASVAGGGSRNLGPTDIFNAGINMAQTIWTGMTITSPGLSILLVLAGIINVYAFAMITGKLIEVLVESVFVAYAGVFMMGFGGSSFTREYAIAQFRYGISVGAKRFVLQLIIGLAQGLIVTMAETVATSGSLNWQTIGVMMGAPVVLLRLVETLPQRAQDMVNGQASSSAGSIGSTVGAVAASAATVAATLAGAPAAAKAAYQLAAKQLEDRDQQSGGRSSGVSRVARLSGMAARNVASSASGDVGKRLNGTGGRHGSRPWRMATDMKRNAGK